MPHPRAPKPSAAVRRHRLQITEIAQSLILQAAPYGLEGLARIAPGLSQLSRLARDDPARDDPARDSQGGVDKPPSRSRSRSPSRSPSCSPSRSPSRSRPRAGKPSRA